MRYLILSIGLLFIALGCKKDKVFSGPTPYELDIPSHFPTMIIPDDNPMTVEGVELGRRLFYDKRLSGDNSQACATCHLPSAGFSDPEQFSTGIDGIQGDRNSMALINLGWNTSFFWDGRSKTLEEQIIEPVVNPIEMHEEWKDVIDKLSGDQRYQEMFGQAFMTKTIDSLNAAKAMAQFIRTLISSDSKFDVMYRYEYNFELSPEEEAIYQTITPSEWAGYDLFKSLNGADCFHCHNGPLMQVHKFSNNGLDATFTDLGRGLVTGNPNDNGKFKVPTLRNIAYTAPYMHDGRFQTLDEVIDHYSFGVVMSPTIDPNMEFASQGGVQLDAFERDLLKQFLMTLTDDNFVNNPNFQEPQ